MKSWSSYKEQWLREATQVQDTWDDSSLSTWSLTGDIDIIATSKSISDVQFFQVFFSLSVLGTPHNSSEVFEWQESSQESHSVLNTKIF